MISLNRRSCVNYPKTSHLGSMNDSEANRIHAISRYVVRSRALDVDTARKTSSFRGIDVHDRIAKSCTVQEEGWAHQQHRQQQWGRWNILHFEFLHKHFWSNHLSTLLLRVCMGKSNFRKFPPLSLSPNWSLPTRGDNDDVLIQWFSLSLSLSLSRTFSTWQPMNFVWIAAKAERTHERRPADRPTKGEPRCKVRG